jgi:hypothetical protein
MRDVNHLKIVVKEDENHFDGKQFSFEELKRGYSYILL